jgi:hypothetical protein
MRHARNLGVVAQNYGITPRYLEGLWQELLYTKYLCGKMLSQVQAKPTDSPFWKRLVWVIVDIFVLGMAQGPDFGKTHGLGILL